MEEAEVVLCADCREHEAVAPSETFLERIPRDFARHHLLFSLGRQDGKEVLAVSERTDPFAIHNAAARLGVPVTTALHGEEQIARWIDAAYGCAVEVPEGAGLEGAPEEDVRALLERVDRDLLGTEGKGQVVRLVDALLFEALGLRASDIHLQPLEDRTLVRYRVDGTLHTIREISKPLGAAVTSRVKVMGRMDIAERRVPQDGRATVTAGDRAIDLRIASFPTSYGERTVLRLLDSSQKLLDFDALGMPSETAERFLRCARRANGLVLVTGPTGSGKTTTLYATLTKVASPDCNVMTIEDPIEYELSTPELVVSQAQVNLKKGVTFATGLRHVLRQDPDVILVGEIRDAETARIAIQASLTGHLVFSTLHTNDAPSAVTRLFDLGVEPYLVSASLTAVLAQRLVRKLDRECEGKGCPACLQTGYRGRTGIFELVVVNGELRGLIAQGAGLDAIAKAARDGGTSALHEEGRRLVERGVTNLLEIERVVQGVT
jgi:general secretion pathway protein E